MKLLSAEDISYSTPLSDGNIKHILKNISFCIGEGLTFGMTGESGSGKTTLAKIIAGHLKPTSGRIILNITPSSKANPVQLLFQNSGNILNPLRKVFEVVSEAAYVSLNERSAAEQRAEHLLNTIGINSELWERRGYELSGGEQQRAALARILAVDPKLLILDEPFAAQDIQSQVNLLNLLKNIKTEFGLTIICISHNQKVLKNFSDEIITLKKGTIIPS